MKSPFTSSIIAITLACGAALVAGCSGSSGGVGQSDPAAVEESNLTEVASVSGAGVTLTFFAAPAENGKQVIGIRENGSAFAKSSPVAALVAQELTSQEIYLAFAPDGATAPAALVAAQADEAAALGRSADVRHATIDRNAVVEKDLAACKSALFVNISSWGGPGSWSAGPSGTFGGGFTTESLPETARPVVLGACNESSADVFLNGQGTGKWPGAKNPIVTFGADMGAFQYYLWFWVFSVPGTCSQQNGACVGSCAFKTPSPLLGCLAVAHGATYSLTGATGSSAMYDLVTGNWIPQF
jgi:hypothetical protein